MERGAQLLGAAVAPRAELGVHDPGPGAERDARGVADRDRAAHGRAISRAGVVVTVYAASHARRIAGVAEHHREPARVRRGGGELDRAGGAQLGVRKPAAVQHLHGAGLDARGQAERDRGGAGARRDQLDALGDQGANRGTARSRRRPRPERRAAARRRL